MHSTSARPGADGGSAARARNGPPDVPAVIAVTSPLHEILIQDVAASVPDELRERVRTASTIAELNDWLAAAAMYRWIAAEPYLARVFLGAMTGHPRDAALTLARAVAARMDPPPRDAQRHEVDRGGLYLQLGLVLCCLAGRAFLVGWLAGPWPAVVAATWDFWLSGVLDLPLLTSGARTGLPVLLACLCVACWHMCEMQFAPSWFERVRRMPARARGLPPPRSWRLDAFQIVWSLQAGLLWVAVIGRAAVEVARAAAAGPTHAPTLAGAAGLLVTLALTAPRVVSATRRIVSPE